MFPSLFLFLPLSKINKIKQNFKNLNISRRAIPQGQQVAGPRDRWLVSHSASTQFGLVSVPATWESKAVASSKRSEDAKHKISCPKGIFSYSCVYSSEREVMRKVGLSPRLHLLSSGWTPTHLHANPAL